MPMRLFQVSMLAATLASFGTPSAFAQKPEPDHLVPVDPYPDEKSERHRKLWRAILLPGDERDDAYMVIIPSLDPMNR